MENSELMKLSMLAKFIAKIELNQVYMNEAKNTESAYSHKGS
jgi:hypothetical protein